MNDELRQFLQTVVWLFMRHGRRDRARRVCMALHEAEPRDGVSAVALAELLVSDGEAEAALEALRMASVPRDLEHAEAVLETRALRMLGRRSEAESRWSRYVESQKGAGRRWIAQ